MSRTHARDVRSTADDEQSEPGDMATAPVDHEPVLQPPRPSQAGYAVALLAVVTAMALSPAVPDAALLEAGTYLAPLALFLGLLSTTDPLAGR